jgi:hypothetical protein
MKTLKDGDEIAILPRSRALPSEVLGIAKVIYAGELFIEVDDGRIFATSTGLGLNNLGSLAIVTDWHRAALAGRSSWRRQRQPNVIGKSWRSTSRDQWRNRNACQCL